MWSFTAVFNTAMFSKEKSIIIIISEIGAKWEQGGNICE